MLTALAKSYNVGKSTISGLSCECSRIDQVMNETRKFDALTIDTQAIQKQAFRFENAPLNLLRQFRGSPIQVVFATIVVKETTAHLEEAIRTLSATLRKVIPDCDRLLPEVTYWFGMRELEKIEPGEVARKRLRNFLTDIEAAEVGTNWADLQDIERRYFDTLPPFAGSGNKKHEFPDAIALSSIEGWAKANGKRVLAVSEDKGWIGYDSEMISVVPTLSEALGILQNDPQHRTHLFVAERIRELTLRNLYPSAATFFQLLVETIKRSDFDIDAHSNMLYEADYPQVELIGYSIENDFTIVKIDEREIIAEIKLGLHIRVSVIITFAVHDSIDDDDVPMGDAKIIRDIHLKEDTQALVTFSGDFQTDGWNITEIELSSISDTIDLGFVEPDWSNRERKGL